MYVPRNPITGKYALLRIELPNEPYISAWFEADGTLTTATKWVAVRGEFANAVPVVAGTELWKTIEALGVPYSRHN